MFHTFDKEIQLYPALAAEHIMLSMTEGVASAKLVGEERKIAILPLDVSIFATSLLGSLYYRLSQQHHIKRIVYIWSDATVQTQTLKIPKASGVKQVLGKTIHYADSQTLFAQLSLGLQFQAHDAYFIKSEFRYTHVHYASFLDSVELCPLVFSQEQSPESFFDILRQNIVTLSDTFFIMSDDFRFKIEDSKKGLHILTLKQEHYNWFDMFCAYCDIQQSLPTIMRVELLEHNTSREEKIYQGILLA